MSNPILGPDIHVYEGNNKGHDLVCGDIHGEITLLAHAVKDLKPSDRLFIVGDLGDRGENSLEVYNFIKQHNAVAGNPPIIPIKGNHEILLENYLHLRLHSGLTEKEIQSHRTTLILKSNGGGWALNLDRKKLIEIEQQLKELPYIIRVNGNNPFNIVHADMPFDDNELLKRIANKNLTLSNIEKEYSTWARKISKDDINIQDVGRTKKSDPTYCGHSILDGVRSDTNHLNLDVGSYDTKHIAIVNHSTSNCAIYTTKPTLSLEALSVQFEINKQLQSQQKNESFFPNNFSNKVNLKRHAVENMIPKQSGFKSFTSSFFSPPRKDLPALPTIVESDPVSILASLVDRIYLIKESYPSEKHAKLMNQYVNEIEKIVQSQSPINEDSALSAIKLIVKKLERFTSKSLDFWANRTNLPPALEKKVMMSLYINFLNEHENHHHLNRMTLCTLRDIYQTYNDKVLASDKTKFNKRFSEEVALIKDYYSLAPLVQGERTSLKR